VRNPLALGEADGVRMYRAAGSRPRVDQSQAAHRYNATEPPPPEVKNCSATHRGRPSSIPPAPDPLEERGPGLRPVRSGAPMLAGPLGARPSGARPAGHVGQDGRGAGIPGGPFRFPRSIYPPPTSCSSERQHEGVEQQREPAPHPCPRHVPELQTAAMRRPLGAPGSALRCRAEKKLRWRHCGPGSRAAPGTRVGNSVFHLTPDRNRGAHTTPSGPSLSRPGRR